MRFGINSLKALNNFDFLRLKFINFTRMIVCLSGNINSAFTPRISDIDAVDAIDVYDRKDNEFLVFIRISIKISDILSIFWTKARNTLY